MNHPAGEIKENALLPSKHLFLDTKTLGLLKEKDRNHPILGSSGFDKARMISIAFAFYLENNDGLPLQADSNEGYGKKEHHFIVRNHRFHIPPYIELLTGISNEDIKNIDVTTTLNNVLQTLMEYVDENTIIVAHDSKFQKIVIANELFHAGMSKELELWKSLRTYCTLQQSITNKEHVMNCVDNSNLEVQRNMYTSGQSLRCCLRLFIEQGKSGVSTKQQSSGTSTPGIKFNFGMYCGQSVSDVVVNDPRYCKHVLRDMFMTRPVICEEIDRLIEKYCIGDTIPVIELGDTIKTLFLAYKRNEIFNNFKIEINFLGGRRLKLSRDLERFITKQHKLSPPLCGIFINYLCRYLVELDNFLDARLDRAVAIIKRFSLDREGLIGLLKYFPKEITDDDAQILQTILAMETETKEALLKWFKLLPLAYNKKEKDCRDIFVCSLAYSFLDFRCEGFKHFEVFLQTIYDVDLTSLADFIQDNFPRQNTLCGHNLGNEDIIADAHLIVNDNEILEIKVTNSYDECYFPELIGYTALAKHVSKLNITKISVLNLYRNSYNVYDVSKWNIEDRERFYFFLTNETLKPLSDY